MTIAVQRGKSGCFKGGDEGVKSNMGTREKVPIKERQALNVNGPMSSIATICATNAKPHMAAVIIRRKRYFMIGKIETCLLTINSYYIRELII